MSFQEIPSNLEVPLTYLEYNTSDGAEAGATPYKVLLVGQSVAGEIVPSTTQRIVSESQLIRLFGIKSDVLQMYRSFRSLDLTTEVHAGALKFDSNATPANHTISVDFLDSAQTKLKSNGSYILYVFGNRISVSLTKDMTETQIVTAIKASIDKLSDTLIKSSSIDQTTGILSIESSIVGEYTSELTISEGFGDELSVLSNEIRMTFTPTSGTGEPDLSKFLDAMPATHFKIIVFPWVKKFGFTSMSDHLSKRFGALQMQGGVSYTGTIASAEKLIADFGSLNSKFVSISSFENFRTPGFIGAARIAGAISPSLQENPAVPVSSLELGGSLYPPERAQSFELRNQMINTGLSTVSFSESSGPSIERLVTTYRQASSGIDDRRFRDINAIYVWVDFRSIAIARNNTKFRRHIFVDDGKTTKIRPGTRIVTPKSISGHIYTIIREYAEVGWFENIEEVKKSIVTVRDPKNPQRANTFLKVDPSNQLQILGIQITTLG